MDNYELVDSRGNTYDVNDVRYLFPKRPATQNGQEDDDDGDARDARSPTEGRDRILIALRDRHVFNGVFQATWAAATLHQPKWKDDKEVQDEAIAYVQWCLQKMSIDEFTRKNIRDLFERLLQRQSLVPLDILPPFVD